MNVSKRVLFFKSKKAGHLLFCGNSNSFYQIEDELAPKIKKMLESGDCTELPEDIIKEFTRSGVLLKENEDEFFNRMKYISYLSRFDNSSLTLTIAPTMACNFCCSYCYEGNRVHNSVMSDEIMDAIINYIKMKEVKSLHLYWYGGEPLCAWPKILQFNERIKELNIPNYTQRIVTNGSLMDEEKIKYFIDNDFKTVQITLDGNEEVQNKRRPMKSGGNSYAAIIGNLDKAYKYCKENNKTINIVIRINIDQDNIDIYPCLHKMLEERYEGMFSIYPSFVKNYLEADCHANNCLTFEKSADFIINLSKKYGIYTLSLFPKQNIILSCPAQKVNTYVIGSNGDMYKCWDDICIESRKLGNILTGIKDTHNINPLFVMKSSAFENEKCKNCLFLFSCMGGCARSRFTNEEAKYEVNPLCHYITNNPQEFLEEYYELKMKGK
jgi:uncharacterized protein